MGPRSRIGKVRLSAAGKVEADRAMQFFSNLKLSTGEYAGKPVNLMDWQVDDLIRPVFGTLNPDGRRQYRTVYLEIPRKNTKTETGAMFANKLLFADDEIGAQIYSAAGDRQQASLVYNAAAPMVEQSPALMSRAKINASLKRISVRSTNSFYQVLSAEAYTKHGLNAHGILFDELHTQPDRELWDVLRTSTGARRQPLTGVMTTAGYDRNSIAWEIHDYACKVRDGIIEDKTFLPIIYAAPEAADWTNEDVWRACNPAMAYGIRSIEEMRVACKQAKEMPAYEMTFRRLYLNQWVNSVKRWLPMDKWRACGGKINVEELKGRPCYAGLDLSSNIDLTALVLVFPMDDESYIILPFFWLPEDNITELEKQSRINYRAYAKQGFLKLTSGNVIDYDFIRHTINELRSVYDIRELAFDEWNSTQIVQQLYDDGFAHDEKEAGNGHPLIVPFRQGYKSLSPPTKDLMTLVLQKKIRHGNHPILNWNADNLVVSIDPAGNIKPDKAKATQKIDGMVAMIMALDRAIKHKGAGPSVYEKRGIKFFG